MMAKLILWDWNGTLLDDLMYGIGVRNRTFPPLGLPAIDSVEAYHRQFTFPIRLYYERAGVTDENFVQVAHAWMDEYLRGFPTVPLHQDARDVLARFREAGIRQVILSATKLAMLTEQVAQFGIEGYFSDILGLDNIYAGSKEDIGVQFVQRSGVAPEDVCVLGDTLHDADVARAIGAKCVLIARGHQSRDTLREAGYPVVGTLEEAAEIVLG